MDLDPTPSQTAGPYFHLGCTTTHSVSQIMGSSAKGERMRLICCVFDGEDIPLNDAMIEIWQADTDGRYNHPPSSSCNGFGRLATDANGVCIFETIKPGRVPAHDGGLQAPHLNISVFARGVMKRLATRSYFAGDAANGECSVLALVPEDRRATLMARPDASNPGDWHFEIHLCGTKETVFFDI